jgi:periplasmic protein TonB
VIGAIREWLFGATLTFSFLLHAAALIWAWLFGPDFQPPEAVAPRQGKASIQVRASVDARPEPKVQPKKEVKPELAPVELEDPSEPLPIVPEPQPLVARPQVEPEPVPRHHEVVPVVKKTAKAPSTASTPSRASEGAVDQLPEEAVNPAPPYPEEARQAGQQGTVWVRLTIDATGKVSAARVQESSGYDALDAAALRTVRRWVFRPARRDGHAVAVKVDKGFEFYIRRRY